MTRPPALASIDYLRGQVDILNRLLPKWHAHISAELAHLDGYPPGTNTPKVSGGTTSSSVEHAAIQRATTSTKLDVEDRLDATVSVLRHLIRDVAADIAARAHIEVKRCDAKGREGAIDWSDPLCWNVPSRGPLCDRCSRREQRWRKDHGLTQRTNGVWSAEPATECDTSHRNTLR